MNKKKFLTNKYTLSVLILLACLGVDIWLHKGMSRVIIPSTFTDKRPASAVSPVPATLRSASKHWQKAVNQPALLHKLPMDIAGFETDVYFNKKSGSFQVFHDSAAISNLELETLLEAYKQRGLTASIWFDFKNLDSSNATASLAVFSRLRNDFELHGKMIIESSAASQLTPFTDSGFFTSYYVPYFNPYGMEEELLLSYLDSISGAIQQQRLSALSGYYFQCPVLKRYFPNYPLLTWTDRSNISLVSNLFNKHLENDPRIRVVLYPF